MPRALTGLEGKRFGRWLVLRRVGGSPRGVYWACRCDCGTERNVFGHRMSRGYSQSCGCLPMERRIAKLSFPKGVAAFKSLFREYKKRATQRNLEFLLSEEQFKTITLQSCFYCGVVPKQIRRHLGRNTGPCIFNGVDRANSSLGYTEENCLPCCGTCNFMKNIMNADQFIAACTAVCDHRRKEL